MKAAPLAILLLLAGCAAVGPDYEHPTAPQPTAELFAGDGVEADSLALWWRDFHDPVLAELIEQGLKNAPSVEAAIARLRAQRATREGTEAGFYPQFSADGSYTWGRGWGAGRRGWEDQIGASANASWEIDVFGGVRRAVEQAAAEEARLAYNIQEVRVSLAAEIATAYVNVRRYAAQVDIAEANLALQERNAATIRARFEAGEVARYDLVAAEEFSLGADELSALLRAVIFETAFRQNGAVQSHLGDRPVDRDVGGGISARPDGVVFVAQRRRRGVVSGVLRRVARESVMFGFFHACLLRAVVDEARDSGKQEIDRARASAARIQADLTAKAGAEAQSIIANARSQASLDTEREKQALRADFARLVALTTAQVTGKVLSEADHRAINAEAIRIYVNGLNLLTFDKYPAKYIDPEQNNELLYPVFRTFNIGLNLTF